MANVLEEQANFSRVARIILDLNSKVQREYLSVIVPAADFPQNFRNPKLNKSQKAIVLNILKIGTYDECDSSLLYILIRSLCNIKPMSGWDKPVQPYDISVADDIERLRLFRNNLYGHATTAKLSNTDFNTFLQEIRAIMGRFDSCHGWTYQACHSTGNYEIELNDIITSPMDPVLQNHYKCHFIQLNKLQSDMAAQDTKIAVIEENLSMQGATIEIIKENMSAQDTKIANVAQEVKTINETLAEIRSDDHLYKDRHEHELEYVYRMRWTCSICNSEYENTRSYYCLICCYTKCMTCMKGNKSDSTECNRMPDNAVIDVLKDDGTPHSNFVGEDWCISCHHCESSDKPFDVLKDFNRGDHIRKGTFHKLYESGFTKRYSEKEFDEQLKIKFLSTFKPQLESQPWLLTNLDIDNSNDRFHITCNTLYRQYVNSNYSFLIVDYCFNDHINNLGIDPIMLKKDLKIYEQEDASRRILLYRGEIETLFIMRYTESTSEIDISNEVIQAQNDVKLFTALHMETLNQSDITVAGLVMTSGLIDKNLMSMDICRTCFKEDLIISTENISDRLSCIEERIVKRRKSKDNDIEEHFLSLASRIIGFISIKSIYLPNISADNADTLSRVYLNQQQRKFVHSKTKHVILKGGFGSGKTVMTQIRLQYIIQTADPNDYVYFIFQSNDTMLKMLMQLRIDSIKNRRLKDDHIFIMNGEEYCQKYGLLVPLMVSEILQDLAERHEGSTGKPHLIMDEVDGSYVTEKEGMAVNGWLTQFKESYVLLITHSLEIIRKRVTPKLLFLSEDFQYDGFRYGATGMEITILDQTMRNTTRINAISQRTIQMLKKSKNVFYDRDTEVQLITSNDNFIKLNVPTGNNSSFTEALTTEKESPREGTPLQNTNSNQTRGKTFLSLISTRKKTSSFSPLTQIEPLRSKSVPNLKQVKENIQSVIKPSNVENETSKPPSIVKNKLPMKVTVNSNIDHVLKHVKEYPENRSGMKLVSRFNFPGSWDHGHGVEGDIPSLIRIILDNPLDHSNVNKPDTKAIFCYVLKKVIKLRLPIDGFGIICFDSIESQLFYTVVKGLGLPVILYTPTMNTNTKLIDIEDLTSKLHSHVIITDHMGSRGLEFKSVILAVNTNEEILHQYLLEAVTRCVYQLNVIAINQYKKSDSGNITCGDIIDDWSKSGLVKK